MSTQLLEALTTLDVRATHALVGTGDDVGRMDLDAAKTLAIGEPMLMLNRVVAARRLGLRALVAFDLLELFAFVRPARFTVPTLGGMAEVLSLDITGEADQDLRRIAARLLAEVASETYRYRAGADRLGVMLARAGWPWGPLIIEALSATPKPRREEDGFAVWAALKEWEDRAPPPPPGDDPVDPEESRERLSSILGEGAEQRDGQRRYAAAATHVFAPRELGDGPNTQLLEAGTGTGKTLGYLAPASLWAEKNDGPVWVSTYTKNLQRQLDQELARLYPDPKVKRQKTVIRKGRENYLCLLNLEDIVRAIQQRLSLNDSDPDAVLIGLVARWARFTRDGDMIGGDFPSWLGAHFGLGRMMSLTDRRGECLYSACAHYRKCFIEKASRASRSADIVVANHALVMAQAVNRAGDPDLPKRVVFDEGHHLFDAADSAFALRVSGSEGQDLRRWLRGKEQGGKTRARGLRARLDDLVADAPSDISGLLSQLVDAAAFLPTDGWLNRVVGAAAMTPFERFLMAVRAHVLTRAGSEDAHHSLEIGLNALGDEVISGARALIDPIDGLGKGALSLARGLLHWLDEDSDTLESADRGRLESVARSLDLRAHMLMGWRDMLTALDAGPDPLFVDWFTLDRAAGRDRDVGLYRHFVDPTAPFAKGVLTPLHGALITSATLRDHAAEEGPSWAEADARTGAEHLLVPPKRLSVTSPFDYARQAKVLIVGDVNKNSPDQVAAAVRELAFAAGGGTLALFTAIQRLRATYDRMIEAFEAQDKALLAQHVDPIDVATLTAMFRADRDATLLGTDAVRDGVDVPGDSLRLIVFDRVPWPRPTLLHKARRDAFGGRRYDELQTRAKINQAFGRLIRRASDSGLFVMLDGQTPTRLLEGLPDGVPIERVGLAEAVVAARALATPLSL